MIDVRIALGPGIAGQDVQPVQKDLRPFPLEGNLDIIADPVFTPGKKERPQATGLGQARQALCRARTDIASLHHAQDLKMSAFFQDHFDHRRTEITCDERPRALLKMKANMLTTRRNAHEIISHGMAQETDDMRGCRELSHIRQ